MMPVVGPIGLSTAAFGPNCTDCGMGGFTVGSTRARSINHCSRLNSFSLKLSPFINQSTSPIFSVNPCAQIDVTSITVKAGAGSGGADVAA